MMYIGTVTWCVIVGHEYGYSVGLVGKVSNIAPTISSVVVVHPKVFHPLQDPGLRT